METTSPTPPRPIPVRREGVLRARLVVAFLGLSLVPLFGSNTVGFLRSQEIVEGLVERYLVGVAGLQAVHIQERLEQRRLYLEAIASGNRFLQAAVEGVGPGTQAMQDAATPEAVEEYLRRKLTESGKFGQLALFDAADVLFASTDASIDAQVGSARHFPGVTLLPTGDETPPVLQYEALILDETGQKVGTLVATVPLERGGEFLEIPEHVAGAIESFILDDGGRPVFVSHPHGHLSYSRRFESPLTSGPAGRSWTYQDREGVDVIAASAELPDYGWRFIVEAPVADAMSELHGLRLLSWILGAVFVFLVVVAAWLLALGIVAPVQRLVGAARTLGEGDLSVRVPEGGGDEIAELGEAFNEMAGELAANQERIERLHRSEIERAEQLATVGEVASGVAHEIKNPVVGISNGLDLVLRHVEDREDLRPITDEMTRQLKRIERAVRDLLAYARPPEPSFGQVDLDEVAGRALALVQPRAEKAGVLLDIHLSGSLSRIQADAELLVQAAVNLMINAIQFSEVGSTVTVRTFVTEHDVALEVADEGQGMSDDVGAALFRPFFTTRHAGTGLGLSITRGIAEQHGGRIEVESQQGVGSSFTLRLPLADATGDGA